MAKEHLYDLFGALKPEVRAALLQATDTVNLKAGETLFEAGDPGDALYVVLAGSLGAYFPGPSGHPQLSAVIKPGETAGELAVISGGPRSATIIAIRDCKLIKLTTVEFDRLMRSRPDVMNELNRLLVHRLQQVSNPVGSKLEPKTIAFLPAGRTANVELVVENISRYLKEDSIAHTTLRSEKGIASLENLSKLEAKHDLILFVGKYGEPDWNLKCARQADRILIIANGPERPHCELPVEILRQRAAHQLVDLILMQPSNIDLPTHTKNWLKAVPGNRHFHIRDRKQDWQHLVRILTGRGIGVVFSGGGARAYAHIGTLKAIEELGMTVDFIGGTSMGAIIAACHARGWGLDEIIKRICATFVRSNPLSDYTLPLLSLVRGNKVERLLYENFLNANIADLWTPYFCASANLTNGHVHIHRIDPVWKALRSSIALPGILPPVPTESGILVDGGVLDNMPVDVMRGIHRGPVIAVDVARENNMDADWLARECGRPWWSRAMSPPIIPILMRSGTVSGEAVNRRQADHADLTIEPPLGEIEVREWKRFEETVEIGYQESLKQLKAYKSRIVK